MSTLVTMPYKKWDPFTDLWPCNPMLALSASLSSLRAALSPVEAPITGLSREGFLVWGPAPCSALLALGYCYGESRELFHGYISAKPAAWS